MLSYLIQKFLAASIDVAAVVNPNGIKTFLADGLSTIFIESKPVLVIIAQKMKFSIKDFFSKCDQIHGFLQKLYFRNLFIS